MDYLPLWAFAKRSFESANEVSMTHREVADLLGADHISIKELCADVPRNQNQICERARYEFRNVKNQRVWTLYFWKE